MPPHDMISLHGKVVDIFAHRFVIETKDGRHLADLGPDGAKRFPLEIGDDVSLTGARKPSEIKVSDIARKDSARLQLEHKKKKPKPHHDHDDVEPKAALDAVKAAGFAVLADPRRKPKHFEILARKGSKIEELRVELDGHIRKSKPVSADERKWSGILSTGR